jgi:hypothetical protein
MNDKTRCRKFWIQNIGKKKMRKMMQRLYILVLNKIKNLIRRLDHVPGCVSVHPVQVNGKRCQFKDVAKLLRAKGIDLDHNRFLILQVDYLFSSPGF